MTIRVTQHTRRKDGGKCCMCPDPINAGEPYRQLIAIQSEAFEKGFARRLAHEFCVNRRTHNSMWEPTTPAVIADRVNRRLEYIRERYMVPAWYGRHVTIKPRTPLHAVRHGTVVGGGSYVEVKVDDGTRGFYHPGDLDWPKEEAHA